ncbi:hypothetical protein CROQUDRAFT_667704 [Cronartium quercuum f. sp. fusiforme G11]|uniref:Phenol 2-monooxygenase n=1 Tax=Cronartium quercuum f. sp. fusiforme G11 TaxID=708437 RepID=A0A9P6NWH1_9BASI|nr:hypothetical protein CROQUDRAFT_667704 [Cronartium quercuum f. sp. fusiforme G11]
MAAACLARYGVHNVRIIDKRSTKIFTRQADAFTPRTLEILQGLGIGAQLISEANEIIEICFWGPIEAAKIMRTGRVPITTPGLSRYRHCGLHQGRIEHMLLDKIALWSTPLHEKRSNYTRPPLISVERAICPELMNLPSINASALSDALEDRIVVRLRHLTEAEAKPAQFCPSAPDGLFRSNVFEDDVPDASPIGLPQIETLEEVRCRYVIGADGARSWTRASLGFKLEGESSDFFWGVIDGVPFTDFPDTRKLCCIHSATSGSILMIPRENEMIRIYIQLPQVENGERPNRNEVTPEKLLKLANLILAPYVIQIPKVEWFTCYQIDACHTHSPKLGQGMNLSMGDAFNLSWKLAHVLQGKVHSKILDTYEFERQPLAAELIEIDRKLARLFSGMPAKDDLDCTGISLADFQRAMERGLEFASGTTVEYHQSIITSKPYFCHQATLTGSDLAKNIIVGRRLHSHQVVGITDAKPYQIADLALVDGKWRLLIFGGDIVNDSTVKERLEDLLKNLRVIELFKDPHPRGQESKLKVEPLLILASTRLSLEHHDFDDILRPLEGKSSFRSHRKIYTDDQTYHQGHGHAYKNYDIDRILGCVIVIRPDQHVSLITRTTDHIGIMNVPQIVLFYLFESKPATPWRSHKLTVVKSDETLVPSNNLW